MNFGLILLTLLGFALVVGFVHILNEMDNERQAAARRSRTRSGNRPFSSDSVTYGGHS